MNFDQISLFIFQDNYIVVYWKVMYEVVNDLSLRTQLNCYQLRNTVKLAEDESYESLQTFVKLWLWFQKCGCVQDILGQKINIRTKDILEQEV